MSWESICSLKIGFKCISLHFKGWRKWLLRSLNQWIHFPSGFTVRVKKDIFEEGGKSWKLSLIFSSFSLSFSLSKACIRHTFWGLYRRFPFMEENDSFICTFGPLIVVQFRLSVMRKASFSRGKRFPESEEGYSYFSFLSVIYIPDSYTFYLLSIFLREKTGIEGNDFFCFCAIFHSLISTSFS